MKPQSLLSAVKALGGVNIREIADLTGEHRTGRAGIPVGLFRTPGRGRKAGLKTTGFGLDELCVSLRATGWPIPDDPVDGGVAALRDLIAGEISGRQKIYASDDQEAVWEAEREAYYAREIDAPRVPRLLALAQLLRAEAKREQLTKGTP